MVVLWPRAGLLRFSKLALAPRDDRRAGDFSHRPVQITVHLASGDQVKQLGLLTAERLARLRSPQIPVFERQ